MYDEMLESRPRWAATGYLETPLFPVDPGALTGLPRIEEASDAYTTWWGTTTIRLQSGLSARSDDPTCDYYRFLRLYGASQQALKPILIRLSDVLSQPLQAAFTSWPCPTARQIRAWAAQRRTRGRP